MHERAYDNTWTGARQIQVPSGTFELLSEGRPCATVNGVDWFWCALRRVGGWRVYSGVIPVPPTTAPMAELEPELRAMVKRAKW